MANKILIHADCGENVISRHIYGHFAEHLGRCIYEGIWVGENSSIENTRGIRNDVVDALKKLNMPNLRWPGGCFADTYHWKDGIGEKSIRPSVVNIHWGGTTENNHFGTHEFLDLCAQLNTEPYICGNVGSGTVREMAEWLEYITMPGESPMAVLRRKNGRDEAWRLKYWGVGNENWGCGGNMRPEYYADEYKKYATYCQNFGGEKLYKIACGFNDDWNEVLLREAHKYMDACSIHYYTHLVNYHNKGAALNFSENEWFATIKNALGIEQLIVRTKGLMDRYDPEGRIGLIVDEWGTWFDAEDGTNPRFLYQQNSLRDAMVAAVSLNVFNKHCNRIHMANIAQLVNVLQAMILTDGRRMLLTPTYHVFEMYKCHQDSVHIPVSIQCEKYLCGEDSLPSISVSASKDGADMLNITMCNVDPNNEAILSCDIRGASVDGLHGRILTAKDLDAHNSFDYGENVTPLEFEGFSLTDGNVKIQLPPKSIVALHGRSF